MSVPVGYGLQDDWTLNRIPIGYRIILKTA